MNDSNYLSVYFKDDNHKKFYERNILKCRYQDTYHKALIYCLGISKDVRSNINSVYDFEKDSIKNDCFDSGAGWMTHSCYNIIRLAFNLFTSRPSTMYNYDTPEDKIKECSKYTVDNIFASPEAKYFFEAIKLRYPHYCC